MTLISFFQGYSLGLGLIVAIGAQNAFVLANGLKRNHPLVIALLCSLSDTLLITCGIFGFGTLLATSPLLCSTMFWAGALYLLVFSVRAFRSACRASSLDPGDGSSEDLVPVVLLCLAVSLLNPHAYLDTVVVLGSLAGGLPLPERFLFAAGAITASFSWFFSLAFGARLLGPLFSSSRSWQVLDCLIGLTMLGLAITLLLGR
jgi:L-lysine exporter family protein LysE/ArgO